MRLLFKALVRYFYSESDYNPHLGGDGLGALFSQENPILHWRSSNNVMALETALLALQVPAYSDYRRGVSLYAGYSDYGQNPPLRAIESDEAEVISRWSSGLANKSLFGVEEDVITKLRPLSSYIETTVLKGTSYWRARIGYAASAHPLEFGPGSSAHYRPFKDASLGAPPASRVGSGRMNREGVPFLYLSSDPLTAVSELKPHPGHLVSLGQFRSRRRLNIADVTSPLISDFYQSDAALDQFLLLKSIDGLFSRPLPPEMRRHYAVTQLIADALWRLGFEGVRFQSSVASGSNLVVFNPALFKYHAKRAKVVQVTSLRVNFVPKLLMSAKRKYFPEQVWD